ncbi:glycoside hydrolase superfamily [Aspergillus terricola var. indicus]
MASVLPLSVCVCGETHERALSDISVNLENLLMGPYTYLNNAFAFIDPKSYKIANMQDSDEEYMPRLTWMKNYNPSLEIVIGGWSMNDPRSTHEADLLRAGGIEDSSRCILRVSPILHGQVWLRRAEERSGASENFENYVSFLKNLRAVLGNRGLIITLPTSFWYLQYSDIKNMGHILDWFNFMSYNLHGAWDGTNPNLGPHINSHTNLTEIDFALELLERNDINPYMAAGRTPSGTMLRSGAVPFAQVFDNNGIFQKSWPTATYPALTFTQNWVGNIYDFFTGLLGRASDTGLSNRFIESLQVCDRNFKNNYNPQERVGILLDVVDMHSYRSRAEVVAAFSSTYKNIATMFGDLTRSAATQVIKEISELLQDLKTNMNTPLAFPVTQMTS